MADELIIETTPEEAAEERITAKSTFHKMMETVHLMGIVRHKRMADGGPMADTQRGRGRVLALLKLKDGIPTKEIAQIVGIRVSSLNETLAKLEKDGYITRVPAEDDKRVMLVQLTEKGAAAEQPRVHFPSKVMAGFTDDELATLNGYLDRMTDNLAAELGEDGAEMIERMREARKEFFKKGHGHGHCHGPHGHGHRHHGHHSPHGHGHDCCHGHGPDHPEQQAEDASAE